MLNKVSTIGISAVLASSTALGSVSSNSDPVVVPQQLNNTQLLDNEIEQQHSKTYKLKLPKQQKTSEYKRYYTDEPTSTGVRDEMFKSYGDDFPLVVFDYNALQQEAEVFKDSIYSVTKESVYQQLYEVGFNQNTNMTNDSHAEIYARFSSRIIMGRVGDDDYKSLGFNRTHKLLKNREKMHTPSQSYGNDLLDSSDEFAKHMGWEKGSCEVVNGGLTAFQNKKSVAHHEVGHFMLDSEYITGVDKKASMAPYKKGEYSSFTHENIADVNRVLQMVQSGEVDKDDYIDQLSLYRSYMAIKGDDYHNSTTSIQALKKLTTEDIQNTDPKLLAKYAINFVLKGDEERGIESPLMSKEEFYATKSMLDGNDNKYHSLRFNLQLAHKDMFGDKEYKSMSTPLQIQKLVKNGRFLSEENKEFLKENIIAFEHTMVTAMDYENGLTDDPRAKKLHDDQQQIVTSINNDTKNNYYGLVPGKLKIDNPQTDIDMFRKEVQEHVWPEYVYDELDMANTLDKPSELRTDIPPAARKGQLDAFQRELDNGSLLVPAGITNEEAQEVLDHNRQALKNLKSYKEEFGELHHDVLIGEANTPEKRSKRTFVESYNESIAADTLEEKLHLHNRFTRQFEGDSPAPPPLDTTPQEMEIFLSTEKHTLLVEMKNSQKYTNLDEQERVKSGRVITNTDNLFIIAHDEKEGK